MTARTEDVEGQLAELQRKYRIMEGNRKSYSEDSQKVIMHQRQTIEKLKEENQRLTAELELETKATSKPPTLAYQERLSRAQDAADQYTRKIELEKRKVEELSRAIEMCEAKFLEMRKKMGGLYSAKDNNMQVAKQVKVLENRLDKALVNFNEALANNKRLRDEIDSLRRERVVFDNIYKKMERELTEKKKEMANIIEVANIGFEARDQGAGGEAQEAARVWIHVHGGGGEVAQKGAARRVVARQGEGERARRAGGGDVVRGGVREDQALDRHLRHRRARHVVHRG